MPHAPRHKIIPAVYLVLIREGNILLGRRCNTGYQDGNYALPAGHLEKQETCLEALIRESQEELGLPIETTTAELAHVCNIVYAEKDERVGFFFTIKDWNGEPVIAEPETCDDLAWFPLGKLPTNISPIDQLVLTHIQQGTLYSEMRLP